MTLTERRAWAYETLNATFQFPSTTHVSGPRDLFGCYFSRLTHRAAHDWLAL